MNTDKKHILDIAEICAEKGIQYAIISPGSRNAPLVIAFNRHSKIKCLSIADERVAAFFALGMAQQLQAAVALICTSGSAVINYSPAIVEAYYQNVPLLILTSDRPEEWIDQGDGQTIQQRNIYANYIKHSFQLKQETNSEDDKWYNNKIISEAINIASYPPKGPVHINVPLKEPLYNTENITNYLQPKIIHQIYDKHGLSENTANELATFINQQQKVLIITGMFPPDKKLSNSMNKLAEYKNLVVLTETTSNLQGDNLLSCIDSALETISNKDISDFMPDLLITFGNNITSKRIKSALRKNKPKQHWHISDSNTVIDTFASLTHNIICDSVLFIEALLPIIKTNNSNYKELWKQRSNKIEKLRKVFIDKINWSDLKLFSILLPHIQEETQLQMGNSTPVRYVQLFNANKNVTYFGNRGTSGIDGCTSTAAGAAYINQNRITTLITGDVSFFYDSNALWNQNLSPNLRIILINNTGGNIFRIIEGPSNIAELEDFFETTQNYTAEHICKTFNIEYLKSSCQETTEIKLKDFFASKNRPALLEISTPSKESASILKEYFNFLKTNITI